MQKLEVPHHPHSILGLSGEDSANGTYRLQDKGHYKMGSVSPSSFVSLLVVCSSASLPLLLESSSDSDSDLQYNHVHRGADQ